MRPTFGGLLLCALIAAGCGGSGSVPPPPEYDADAAAQAALGEYDKNKSGSIDGGEVAACPAMKDAIKAIDTNKDGQISADELKARFSRYGSKVGGAGPTAATCRVTFDGNPLVGAKVRFVPEPCLGESFKPAVGTTDETGVAQMKAEVEGWSGVYPGLYKITVSKPDPSGKETVPAKYNEKSALGREVFEERGASATIELKLTR